MVVERKGRYGPLVAPGVALDVTIHKRDHTAPIVRAARKEQENIFPHLHTKIRPADASWVDIGKKEQSSSHRGRKLRLLFEHGVVRSEPIIPLPSPPQIGVHGVTAQP